MTHKGHPGHRDWDDETTWAKERLLEPALVPVTEALLDAVRIRPGERLLDLACGLGQTAAAATARGADALGIDLSRNRTAAARERFPGTRFEAADASTPPAGPWDAVVCRFGAHHLPEGWAQAIHAVLASGGRLAIAEWPPKDERDEQNGMRPAGHWQTKLGETGYQEVRVDRVPTRLAGPARQDPEIKEKLTDFGPGLEDRECLIISAWKR
ncbi:MAG: class I SAM-dependent methyltransferase [Euryarchaeota archaeon]|nr:class I SAM-dependent methyltransferase [Euryarchaeota archaeon]